MLEVVHSLVVNNICWQMKSWEYYLHCQHPHDDSESGSFLTLKIKLKQTNSSHAEDNAELKENSSFIKTDKE